MTNSLPLTSNFQQASLVLKDFLDQVQENLPDLPRLMQKWPETWERYRNSIREMPKVLRKRPFVKRLMAEIESFERETRRGGFSFEALQARAHEASLRVAELEAHPMVQKFLRGETILSSKKSLQWGRKILHASTGLAFLYLFVYSGWPKAVIWGIAGPFIVWSFSLETARHMNPRVNRWVLRAFGPIMREREKTRINSAVFYIFSMVVVYLLTPIEVSMLTLLFIAVGDPLAGIFGVLCGRRRISAHVTWEGSLACFLGCAGLAALCAGLLFKTSLAGLPLAGFALLSGLVGAVAESSLKFLDDNLVMPLLSAPCLWLLMKLFGVLP